MPVSIDMEAGYSADLSDEGVVPRWFLGIIREFRSVAGVWLGLEFALWVS